MPSDDEFECWSCGQTFPEDEEQGMGLCMDCWLNHTNR